MDIIEANETHGYPRPHREAMVRWMRRWLLGKDDAPIEGETVRCHDADLQCTRTGQVLSDLHGKSVFDLNADREAELARRRAEFQAKRGKAGMLAEVRRLIACATRSCRPDVEERGEIKRDGGTVRKLVFTTEPGIEVPALLFTPEHADESAPLAVLVGYDGPKAAGPGGPVEGLLKKRQRVLVADLRGMGETEPESPAARPPGRRRAGGVPLAPPRPPPARATGWRPALGDRRRGRRYPGEAFRSPAEGPPGRSPCTRRRSNPRSSICRWTPRSRPGPKSSARRSVETSSRASSRGLWRSTTCPTWSQPSPRGRCPSIRRSTRRGGRFRGTGSRRPASSRANADSERAAQTSPAVNAGQPQPTSQPLVRAVDLAVGESQSVALADGKTATVKLIGVDEVRDPIRSAIREAKVKVEVNGTPVTLTSGNYQLPVSAGGVQVDCPITGGYRTNSNHDPWGLVKDARIRLWPAGSPWIEPTAFAYPARQRWFASSTQMANEPVYVDGGEDPAVKKIYYHNGLDISGAEGLIDVVSATGGIVVTAGHRPRGLAGGRHRRTRRATSSTCSMTRVGITPTSTCNRSTRRSSRGRPCGWARRSASWVRKGAAAGGRISTS